MRIIATQLILSCFLISAKAQSNNFDWLVAFYMPYDNDLSMLGQPIIEQIKTAQLNGKVCATLQVDFAGPGGMKRYAFNGTVDSTMLTNENSASPATLLQYLTWARNTYPAKHVAVVLLNHGGGLMEYGVDHYPSRQWMPTDSIADVLRAINKDGLRTDLFFQQVCARGTLENLYEFRDAAKYSLAAQTLVPTPGYYYGPVLEALGTGSITSGDQLARAIIQAEHASMYYTLTLVNNSAWPEWTAHLKKYSESICTSPLSISVQDVRLISYASELYWDFASTILATSSNGKVPDAGLELINFTKDRLVTHFISSLYQDQSANCGASILTPFRKGADPSLDIYNLAVFRDWLSCLKKIHKR